MAELKTRKNDDSVEAFIDAIEDEGRREDCRTLRTMLSEVTGDSGAMWGTSIVGFGDHHFEYESGREGDWFKIGFAPRKQALTLYIMPGFDGYDGLLGRLGKHTTGKACLYVKRLSDIDLDVLRQLAEASVKRVSS